MAAPCAVKEAEQPVGIACLVCTIDKVHIYFRQVRLICAPALFPCQLCELLTYVPYHFDLRLVIDVRFPRTHMNALAVLMSGSLK